MKKQVLELTDGKVRLGAGSLYRSIRQLVEQGLIEEAPGRPAAELDDERRVYYRLSRRGRRVVSLETERLQRLLRVTSRVVAEGSGHDS